MLPLDSATAPGLHVALGVALDLVGHRRREQQRLLRPWAMCEAIALDVLEEAHRQHLVALVEDEEADALEVEQRLAADVIEDAAGGADDDVHAGAELIDLLADRRAAVDRLDRQALVLADRASSRQTCRASSRVGVSTIAWGTLRWRRPS
jgi:hypothetical protein